MADTSRSNRGIAALACLYLVAITIAEIVTILIHDEIGVVLHLLVFGALILHSTSRPNLKAFLALSLVPLVRIVSRGLPLDAFDQVWWLGLIAVPLLVAAVLVIHALELTPAEIGIRLPSGTQWIVTVFIAASGWPIGMLLRRVSEPGFVIDATATLATVAIVGVTVFVISLAEELIFRGLVQTMAVTILGTALGIVYGGLLFAIMQLGSRSPEHLAIAFATGVFWGYVRYRTGSLLGVVAASMIASLFYYGLFV